MCLMCFRQKSCDYAIMRQQCQDHYTNVSPKFFEYLMLCGKQNKGAKNTDPLVDIIVCTKNFYVGHVQKQIKGCLLR